jgi:hypothetical protein
LVSASVSDLGGWGRGRSDPCDHFITMRLRSHFSYEPTIDIFFASVTILMQMTERIKASANSELILAAPRLVMEEFDRESTISEGIDGIEKDYYEDIIFLTVLGDEPVGDTDRNGWLSLLGFSYVGYAVSEKLNRANNNVSKEEFTHALQLQLASDAKRWGDTWKERPTEGQLKETLRRFYDYDDQYRNGGQEFPWLKVAGWVIINLYRIDHPEYQK